MKIFLISKLVVMLSIVHVHLAHIFLLLSIFFPVIDKVLHITVPRYDSWIEMSHYVCLFSREHV